MTEFDIHEMRNSSVLYLYSIRDQIQIDPSYQRTGGIWSLEKRQLLIDSLINGFDLPKFYFHDLAGVKKTKHKYAIIDGRQRLETIWGFINGGFRLGDGFVYMDNQDIDMSGMAYEEISSRYPLIKARFDALSLSVFVVHTGDPDLIEEMFSRLNEAVPLNAAEKRNAFGGPLPEIIRDITNHVFFIKKTPISNKRYQHRDVAAKFIYLSYKGTILDTKKEYLDNFVIDHKSTEIVTFDGSVDEVKRVCDAMSSIFTDRDKLLRSSSMVLTYYLLFRDCVLGKFGVKVTRSALQRFDAARERNRKIAEEDIAKAEYELLEFDRLSQSSNDAYANKEKLLILKDFLSK